jgi:GNAT superfamily N-acetyltransferase
MDDLSENVKKLFSTASKQDIFFLRRRPTLTQISKAILNFDKYIKEGTLKGRRINMGEIEVINDNIVVYNAFTIMQNANATPYEKKFIDMGSGLNLIYSSQLYVHPEHRGKGIGTKLIKHNLDLARKLGKHSIIDAHKNNYKMINILLQHEFEEDFSWVDSKGLQMIRYFHE